MKNLLTFEEFVNENYRIFDAVVFDRIENALGKAKIAYTYIMGRYEIEIIPDSPSIMDLAIGILKKAGLDCRNSGDDSILVKEALDKFNIGSLVKHEKYPEMNGTVEVGPDTFDNIGKAGYEMPKTSDYTEETMAEEKWYGITLTDNGRKVGINFDEFIMG